MAFPTSPYQSSSGALHGQGAAPRVSSPAPHCKLRTHSQVEGDHQLEKLEFALAVALTRGDLQRSDQLRSQIAALGGNQEEPGT
ncbi:MULTISPECIES: hypothetical protein [unclassified Synechococcus]|jgi:hypothetical protein|uniref:hypothetical protein n=1 Tax=unclassified Synechococcus TaxID=2626047 RepID=UPI00168820B5|nr:MULTISPECIES: hypothetical protein [unclassified Synechococcus]MBD2719947.1 hypothetical protein [Synechococcus sp. FACHB-909]